MNPQQVAQLIEDGLGGSHAMVTSEDNVHFEAVVVAPPTLMLTFMPRALCAGIGQKMS